MAWDNGTENMTEVSKIKVIPQITHLRRILKAQSAPWEVDRRGKRIQIEQSHVMCSISNGRSPDRRVATQDLVRRMAGLIYGNHFIIAQELFAEIVQMGQIAA